MDYTEISQKSTEQLHDLLAEQREELRELKFKVAENQLADVSKIKKVKVDAYLNDSGTAVLTLYEKYGSNLIGMMRKSDHGKILLENGFEADLEYCSSIDILDEIPVYTNGVLKKLKND